MPTEDDDSYVVLGSLPEPVVDSILDVTEFNTVEIPDDHHLVSVKLYGGETIELVVHKDYVEESSDESIYHLNSSLGEEDMEQLVDLHGICYVNNDNWWKINIQDVRYSALNNEWLLAEEAVFGVINRGDEGYFHCDEDYVRCGDTDNCYVDSDEAEYNDCNYCDGCEDYRDVNHHDFEDCCDDGRNNDQFNNHRTSSSFRVPVYDVDYKKRLLEFNKLNGIDSPTFSKSNGMEYTFGVEIETHRGYIDCWDDLNVASVYDGSIEGNEYVTGVLKGDYGFNHLKKICNAINDSGHQLNSKCGVHVHIGGVFNRRFTIMLLKLCYHLQDDIYRMMPISRVTNSYCKPIPTWASKINFQNFREILGRYIYGGENDVLNKNYNKKNRIDRYSSSRYKWVNINNYSTGSGIPTVEFRVHGASMSYEKLRNWTLICMSLVRYAENNQKQIWTNLVDITLKNVLIASLGPNLGEQINSYHIERVNKFDNTTGQSSSLPSAILERNGVIM